MLPHVTQTYFRARSHLAAYFGKRIRSVRTVDSATCWRWNAWWTVVTSFSISRVRSVTWIQMRDPFTDLEIVFASTR